MEPNPYIVAAFMLFAVLANVAIFKTVAEANAHLPDEQRFTWWWWTIGKHVNLWKAHKSLCPDSHWRIYSVAFFLAAVACMVLMVVTVRVSVTR
jgi:hypothetical protein